MIQTGTTPINLHDSHWAPRLKESFRNFGRQYFTHPVAFDRPFHGEPPAILLSLTMLDTDRSDPAMPYSIEATAITHNQFTLRLGLDTRFAIRSLAVSYLAINTHPDPALL